MAAPSLPPPPAPLGIPPAPPRWPRELIQARAIGLAIAGVAALAGFDVVVWLGVRGVYNIRYAASVAPALWHGFLLTGMIMLVILPIGFGIGLFVGWARTMRNPVIRGLASLYVDFFRSMPPIVLIVFASVIGLIFLVKAHADIVLIQTLPLWLGVLALAFHTSAYQAEIVRAGILSVPIGQTEAAESIGMSRLQTMLRVVLPQAFRVSLPALGNEFSSVIKDSSLLSIIGWLELSGLGLVQIYSGILVYPLAPIIILLEVAALYFAITFALNTSVRAVENWFRVPGLEAARL
ncbi:MAG: amino acid ABC transporter permease [Thermoplasmata archaeon]|nr:amino acid ABC transporter permease [Thermoplasmata archaeon]MCI4353991.1 amino acid ABC transporter permease [Thermoplasmata archaeon]